MQNIYSHTQLLPKQINDRMGDDLKVLRVMTACHQLAKVNSAKKGIKLQIYMERLIEADEQGLIDWKKFKSLIGNKKDKEQENK